MGITPLAFTGASKFSSDLQTILQRAVQIAQLPLRALQNKDSDVLQRKTLLGNLASVVGGLATSLQALGTTAQNRALTATSSNTAAVTVVNSGATSAASYIIDSITSAASAASERISASFLDAAATPVSTNGSMRLVVGAVDYDLTLTNNSLVGLRDKINSLAAGVSASIITTSTGNYLSISANATGETTLQLVDDPAGANSKF
jgi:flagellar hook-associated protein 2